MRHTRTVSLTTPPPRTSPFPGTDLDRYGRTPEVDGMLSAQIFKIWGEVHTRFLQMKINHPNLDDLYHLNLDDSVSHPEVNVL